MSIIFSFKIGFVLMMLNTALGYVRKRELLAMGYKQVIHPNGLHLMLGFGIAWLINSITPIGVLSFIKSIVSNTETLHAWHIKMGAFERI